MKIQSRFIKFSQRKSTSATDLKFPEKQYILHIYVCYIYFLDRYYKHSRKNLFDVLMF